MIERMSRLICDNCAAGSLICEGLGNVRPEIHAAHVRTGAWHLWNGADLCPRCWSEHDGWSKQKKAYVQRKAYLRRPEKPPLRIIKP